MTTYPFCEDREVEVRKYPEGMRKIMAICSGDLGVIREMNSLDFTILHIPSGLSFRSANCVFRYQASAVEAMLAISRLHNRWFGMTGEELRAMAPKIMEIGEKFGGVAAPRGPDVPDYKEDLNGYDAKTGD